MATGDVLPISPCAVAWMLAIVEAMTGAFFVADGVSDNRERQDP